MSRACATSSVAVRDEDAVRLDGPAADPAAQLVELGEPEPVGPLDDHHRRLRHVHADLDDGRADQHVELAVAEARHLGVAVRGLQPAVDEAHPQRREQLARAASPRDSAATAPSVSTPVSSMSGTTTNVRWPAAASSRTFCHVPAEVVRAADPGPDRDPAGGRRAQVRDVEVGVEDLAERPRDRRGGHQQDVRRASAGLRLERVALVDAEAVLLVDDDEAEVAERHATPG